MTFTANRTGKFFINAWNIHTWETEDGGGGNNIYDLSLVHIPDAIASSIETSAILAVDGQATATLERVNDRDWFKATLKKGGVYKFSLIGNNLKDPNLRVRDSHGEQLLYNDQRNFPLQIESRSLKTVVEQTNQLRRFRTMKFRPKHNCA